MNIDDLILEYHECPSGEISLTARRKHKDAKYPVKINTIYGEKARQMYKDLTGDNETLEERNKKISEYVKTIQEITNLHDHELVEYQIRYLMDVGVFDYESVMTLVPRHCGRDQILNEIDKLNTMIDTSPNSDIFVKEHNEVLIKLKQFIK